MLLSTLGGSLLENLFTDKSTIRAGDGTTRIGRILTNFEIQKYYQHESKFHNVYSINNLPKIKGNVICNKSNK